MKATSIAIVKSTVPLIQEVGSELTKHFYGLLFAENPELKNVFNMVSQANGRQQSTLAASILAYAANIDKLEAIGGEVDKIAAKHFSLDIQPEHYPIVGRNLLKAIQEVLGEDVATAEVMAAWAEAYEVLANILIGVEKSLSDASKEGEGWLGFKEFKVIKKVEESSEITSFYLQPLDGKKLPAYKAGQFISIKINDESLDYTEIRQYSLSESPRLSEYRISVKQEPSAIEGVPQGLVSNHLHQSVKEGDILPVHMPTGDFYIKDSDRPIVLISGGVGVTPMLSMLNDLVLREDTRELTWIHGTRNRNTHAFREHVQGLSRDLKNLKSIVFYDDTQGAISGDDYHYEGYITPEHLERYCALEAEFYFCGPLPFMNAVYKHLKQLNVNDEQLHFEVFGPSSTLQ